MYQSINRFERSTIGIVQEHRRRPVGADAFHVEVMKRLPRHAFAPRCVEPIGPGRRMHVSVERHRLGFAVAASARALGAYLWLLEARYERVPQRNPVFP